MPPVPLILLPGYLLDRQLWRAQLDGLGRLAEPIVPDLRGFDAVAAMAAAVLAEAPPRFALAGLSMGGYVALEMVRRAPGRVERLMLVNSQAGTDPATTLARRARLRERVEGGGYAEAVAALVPLMLHRDHAVPGHPARVALEAMYARMGPEVFLRQQQALNGRRDARDVLPEIRCPTVVVGGWQDALVPPSTHFATAQAIPEARLVLLERCGHLSPLEQPLAVARVMASWLEGA